MVTAPVRIGSYRVERLLGIGSFATVWLGYDADLGARVAIKVLAENWSHDLRVRERFLDEGRLLWQLNDDRIVSVHALGEMPDGRPYLVMGWADGGSLRDRLAEAPIAVSRALSLLREICAGVAVLHEHGIVHRDLTPGNVLFRSRPATTVSSAEHVVIADLGLAKALAAASGLTARAGTPGYMAPEQDDPLAIVDRRADVYGLGRLGLRLLGSGLPHRLDQPVRLRDGVPPGVADVLRSATARRPADRYPDAAALGAALDRAVAGRRVMPAVRAAVRVTLGVTAAALAAVLASDSVGERFLARPGVEVDATGRLSIRVPDHWLAVTGDWVAPPEAGGQRGAALLVSPDPDRWGPDTQVPGVFIWLPDGGAASATPHAFLAGRPHADCTAADLRISRLGGFDWVIARYEACADGPRRLFEAATTGPDENRLVYVQIAPPASSEPAFVDSLLAGVRMS